MYQLHGKIILWNYNIMKIIIILNEEGDVDISH